MDMRAETLTELADSIKVQGVIQPIVVRPVITTCYVPGRAARVAITSSTSIQPHFSG